MKCDTDLKNECWLCGNSPSPPMRLTSNINRALTVARSK